MAATEKLTRRLASALAGVSAGLFAVLLAAPAAGVAQPGVQAQLAAADLTLLNGVRLAGLWEMPAGQLAAKKGSRQVVREIGAEIARQHVQLDEIVVQAANDLRVQLPTEPNDQQKQWLAEMRGASSRQEFDQIFVTRLREAHGKIYPIIGAVRASTRNDAVRRLAIEANKFVGNHLTMLESTGLVRYAELPPAALPEQDLVPEGSLLKGAQARAAAGSGFSPAVVWVVLIAALVVGTAAAYRVFRPR